MNPLFDFTGEELALIHMGLSGIASTTKHIIEEEGATPPDGFVETLMSALQKIQSAIELRIENENQFSTLVESQLADVESALVRITEDPTIEVSFDSENN